MEVTAHSDMSHLNVTFASHHGLQQLELKDIQTERSQNLLHLPNLFVAWDAAHLTQPSNQLSHSD